MDEREKLRKFRELDDAFAEALRELEKPDSRLDIPTGPPVRSLEEREAEEAQQRQQAFEQRLKSLMSEYAQPRESVAALLRTMKTLGHIA
ncbi:hypothetical protein H1D44_08705 [Halomonas kenyensis]|uniref:Uncharacterized protein n=2 Tax=Billgrantia kenyensis TaxID=321266 RepID=A0A7V9W0U9_9GAMM|nr:hypothetical protein [Halomonas kenyensis]MCG6662906.1 hypothetical protein [Halomonas kenyensis]